jgi:hypothetical protein
MAVAMLIARLISLALCRRPNEGATGRLMDLSKQLAVIWLL